ncbi:MAG: pitrilysin family protein [Gemmatimonadaceae bacterium]
MRKIVSALLLFAPTTSVAAAQQNPARETPPPLGTPRAFHLPKGRDITLPNGLRITMVPFGNTPKASVYASVRTGHIDEAPNEVWLSDVTADMMREGTNSRTAPEIATQSAAMGGDLSVSAGDDEMRATGGVLAENAPDMVRLIADVLRNPLLPEGELARITANRVRQLSIAKSQPQALAQEQFARAVYGDHPYGRAFPTEEMLKGYTIGRVRDFHARNFNASRAHLYVVGVFDAAAVERAARESFGGWARGKPATVKPPAPKSARTVSLIDRPNAVQSTVILGLPVPGPTSKDHIALEVTDAILGGAFGSRITSNIREQKGYTYSPFSTVSTHYHDAYWAEEADVTSASTGASLTEIFKEIDRLQHEAPPPAELAGIKNNLIGMFTLRNASRSGIVSMLDFVNTQGLGADYLNGYVSRVSAITPADVQRITRTYLRPDRMTLVVVGDKKTVEAQLKPFETVVP